MPTLSPEIVETVPVSRLAAEKAKLFTKRRVGGAAIGTLWLLGSGVASLTEKGTTSAGEKKLFPGVVQVGFNAVVNHPYRLIVGGKNMISDSADESGLSIDIHTGSDEAGSAPATTTGGRVDSAPSVDDTPSVTEVPVAPPAEGEGSSFTATQQIGVWPAVREACAVEDDSEVVDILERSNIPSGTVLAAGQTVLFMC